MSPGKIIAGYYVIQGIVLFLLIVFSWFIWDKRYKSKQGKEIPDGFQRTGEVTIDPVTQKQMRVYYNAETGERFYQEEPPIEKR